MTWTVVLQSELSWADEKSLSHRIRRCSGNQCAAGSFVGAGRVYRSLPLPVDPHRSPTHCCTSFPSGHSSTKSESCRLPHISTHFSSHLRAFLCFFCLPLKISHFPSIPGFFPDFRRFCKGKNVNNQTCTWSDLKMHRSTFCFRNNWLRPIVVRAVGSRLIRRRTFALLFHWKKDLWRTIASTQCCPQWSDFGDFHEC